MTDHRSLTVGIDYYRRGIECWSQGRAEDAIASFERALQLDASISGLPYEEGLRHAQDGEYAGAEGWLWIAHLFRPGHVPTLTCLGEVLRSLGRAAEALPLLHQAVALAPESWEAHSDLALVLRDLDRLEDAALAAETAVRLHGLDAPLASNLASIRKSQGRFDEALALLNHALGLQPDFQAAHVNLGHLLLLHGRLEEGWREYDWRPQKRLSPDRQLRGQPIAGKTILIHQEQGLGDLIQFVRYAAPLSKAGARVIVSCDEKMIPLMRCARGVADAVSWTCPAPAFDFEVNIMSLPRMFSADDIEIPYLKVDQALLTKWSERLRAERRLKVGLVWSGNPANPVNRTRSMPLAQLGPILRDPHVAFYSLQLGPQREELAALPITDLQTECSDILDAAAAMANLDLLISTDTMPVHLAGALGRPVWVLLSQIPDWRWMIERDDSPWYPTARLFRQRSQGDWNGIVKQLEEALKARQIAQRLGERT
jgi:hypothetical protein